MYGIWPNFQKCEEDELIRLGNMLLRDIVHLKLSGADFVVEKNPNSFIFHSVGFGEGFGNGDGEFDIEFYCYVDIITGEQLCNVFFLRSPWHFKVGSMKMNIKYNDTDNIYYNYLDFVGNNGSSRL